MQFKTKLIYYHEPAHTSGVHKEAEKNCRRCQIGETLVMNCIFSVSQLDLSGESCLESCFYQ